MRRTPVYLKNLTISKVNTLVIFDKIHDERDLIRILSQFKKNNKEEKKHCIFFDRENNTFYPEFLEKINKI